jgi:hypothetical protein
MKVRVTVIAEFDLDQDRMDDIKDHAYGEVWDAVLDHLLCDDYDIEEVK